MISELWPSLHLGELLFLSYLHGNRDASQLSWAPLMAYPLGFLLCEKLGIGVIQHTFLRISLAIEAGNREHASFVFMSVEKVTQCDLVSKIFT